MNSKQLISFLTKETANGGDPEVVVQRGDGEPASIAAIRTVCDHEDGKDAPVEKVLLRVAAPRRAERAESDKLREEKNEARIKSANPVIK